MFDDKMSVDQSFVDTPDTPNAVMGACGGAPARPDLGFPTMPFKPSMAEAKNYAFKQITDSHAHCMTCAQKLQADKTCPTCSFEKQSWGVNWVFALSLAGFVGLQIWAFWP